MSRILEVRDLVTKFYTLDGIVHAVNGVGFHLDEGETLAIVGESGSGKSVTMMSLLGLIPSPPGKIEAGKAFFTTDEGTVDLLQMPKDKLRNVRGGQIGFVFQDPISTLNPIMTIGEQIAETLIRHLQLSKEEARQHTIKLLGSVGIPDPELRYNAYPFQFSGGMRQRVVIAIAISCTPKIIIADEPTSALDVVIQRQVMETLDRLQRELDLSGILIGHDMGLMAQFVDQLAVMYAGRLMEVCGIREIFAEPLHPYTSLLIQSLPVLGRKGVFTGIPGITPSLLEPPSGCVFHPRCPYAFDLCKQEIPAYEQVRPGRWIACHLHGELPS